MIDWKKDLPNRWLLYAGFGLVMVDIALVLQSQKPLFAAGVWTTFYGFLYAADGHEGPSTLEMVGGPIAGYLMSLYLIDGLGYRYTTVILLGVGFSLFIYLLRSVL